MSETGHHHHDHNIAVPKPILITVAIIIVASIAAAGITRMLGMNHIAPPPAKEMISRDLRFEDRADGAILVIDPKTETVINAFESGEAGFVRGMLRGVARGRIIEGLGSEQPFTLTRWSDGRVTLYDPTNGTRLELAAFGFANVGEFSQLLTMKGEQP